MEQVVSSASPPKPLSTLTVLATELAVYLSILLAWTLSEFRCQLRMGSRNRPDERNQEVLATVP